MNRKQEKVLERMLKQKGISKQQFIAEQLAQRIKTGIEQQKLRHPNVLRPRCPVTGRPAVRSDGPFGPHFSAHYGLLKLFRRIWMEEPVVTQLLANTPHAHLTDGSRGETTWASSRITGW
jgi:hypothetical protein